MSNEIKPPALPGFAAINRYWDRENEIIAAKLLPGEYYVTNENEMITTVLGSCIAACIRDSVLGIGGMNHFMLPETSTEQAKNAGYSLLGSATRYGNYAMEHLINTILASGGKRKNLEVKVFGGGKIIPSLSDVGLRNIGFVLDYIESMASKDMTTTIHSKAHIDEMMTEIAKLNTLIDRKVKDVSELTQQIENNVNHAVRALQFEDMTRQLIEYMQANTQHFQALIDEMRIGFEIMTSSDQENITNELTHGIKRLNDMKQQWHTKTHKAVMQGSMNEGDIELF